MAGLKLKHFDVSSLVGRWHIMYPFADSKRPVSNGSWKCVIAIIVEEGRSMLKVPLDPRTTRPYGTAVRFRRLAFGFPKWDCVPIRVLMLTKGSSLGK